MRVLSRPPGPHPWSALTGAFKQHNRMAEWWRSAIPPHGSLGKRILREWPWPGPPQTLATPPCIEHLTCQTGRGLIRVWHPTKSQKEDAVSAVCGAGEEGDEEYPVFVPKATLQIRMDLRPHPGLHVCLVSQAPRAAFLVPSWALPHPPSELSLPASIQPQRGHSICFQVTGPCVASPHLSPTDRPWRT